MRKLSATHQPGIYKITCIENGRVYIGQSIDLKSRLRGHINELQKGRHNNIRLQEDFSLYGIGYFTFDVIEVSKTPVGLGALERMYIERYDAYYNQQNVSATSGPKIIHRVPDSDHPVYPLDYADKHRPDWHARVYGGQKRP